MTSWQINTSICIPVHLFCTVILHTCLQCLFWQEIEQYEDERLALRSGMLAACAAIIVAQIESKGFALSHATCHIYRNLQAGREDWDGRATGDMQCSSNRHCHSWFICPVKNVCSSHHIRLCQMPKIQTSTQTWRRILNRNCDIRKSVLNCNMHTSMTCTPNFSTYVHSKR